MGTEKKAAYYDEIFKTSKEYHLHYKKSLYYVVWAQVLKFVKQIPDPKILEIGCGTGQFAHYLYDEGYRDYHGIDFSPEAVKIAKGVVGQSFAVGDSLDKDLYEDRYNLIIALEIMEHIEGDTTVLGNIRDGASIIMSLPTFDDPGHVRWFKNPRDIKRHYYRYIEFRNITRIDRWFVCWGIIDRFEPGFLYKIIKKRKLF